MGNIDGKENEYRLKNKKLLIFSRENSIFFENCAIYKIRGEEKMILSTKINLRNSHNYETSASFNHPNLLKTLNFKANWTDLFYTDPDCVFFEYEPMKLHEMIEKKMHSGDKFEEKELILLMKNIVSILAYFQMNGISHGNINPELIFFDSSSNLFKILDQQLINGYISSFFLTIQGKFFSNYCSPELLISLQEKNLLFVRNSFKNDIFSLGMCILEAATLINNSNLYDPLNFRIRVTELESRLEIVKQTYSFEFYKALESFLILEPSKRADPLKLHNYLKGECKIEIKTKKLNERELPKIINEINIIYSGHNNSHASFLLSNENETAQNHEKRSINNERSKSFDFSLNNESKKSLNNDNYTKNIFEPIDHVNSIGVPSKSKQNDDSLFKTPTRNVTRNLTKKPNQGYIYMNDSLNSSIDRLQVSKDFGKPNCFSRSIYNNFSNHIAYTNMKDSRNSSPTITYLIKTRRIPETERKEINNNSPINVFTKKQYKNKEIDYLADLDFKLEQTLKKSQKNNNNYFHSTIY